MKIRTTLLVLMTAILTACEGIVGGDGNIYTLSTKEPMDSVQVVLFLNEDPVGTCFSDELGHFIGSRFVGCVPTCPAARIIVKKNGYHDITIDFNEYFEEHGYSAQIRDNMRVFMEPL